MELRKEYLKDEQNNAIDLAKFICAILIVAIHVAPFGPSDKYFLHNYFIQNYLARIAVPFFFIASGYFLYRKTTLEDFKIEPTKKYAFKLFKLYLIWSIIYLPSSFAEILRYEGDIFRGIIIYIRNFIFVGSYYQLWFLNATIFAVILISLLLYKGISPIKILIAAYIFYLIGLLDQSLFGFLLLLRSAEPPVAYLWNLLEIIQKVIVTTRNGLFEGFLFVGIGMFFAFYKIKIKKKWALMGFWIFMILMFFEVCFLAFIQFSNQHDMNFFLVPTSFFMFAYILNCKLPDSKIYKNLRVLSSLIFYIHFDIPLTARLILFLINPDLVLSFYVFPLTLVITIFYGVMIIIISNYSRFTWLKNLYS